MLKKYLIWQWYIILLQENLYGFMLNMFWFLICDIISLLMAFYAGQKLRNEVVMTNRAVTKLYSVISEGKYLYRQIISISTISHKNKSIYWIPNKHQKSKTCHGYKLQRDNWHKSRVKSEQIGEK